MVNIAPHPGPLPEGEGEGSAGGKQRLIINEVSGQSIDACRPARKCPLSLRERVGVRGEMARLFVTF
jgi:hypothetical protein